ncbi:MAG: WG repeat-containing protein [Chloroflexota bacterium]
MKLIFSLLIAFAVICSAAMAELIPIIDDNQRLGYINQEGEVVIEPEYSQEISYVRYIYNGDVYPGVEFPNYTYFKDGLATVRKATKFLFFTLWNNYYVIDTAGARVFKSGDNLVYNYSEGVAPIKYSDENVGLHKPQKQWSWVDKTGAEFQPSKLRFAYVSQFKEGYALVLNDNNYGFIDKSGNIIGSPSYEDATLFSEGLASVKIEGKWGYINNKGETVIKYRFDNASPFTGDIARVMDKGAYGYINKAGDLVIKPKYLWATDFSDGLAAVMVDKTQFGYIDKTGKLAVNGGFSMTRKFTEGLGCVEKDGKWGYINTKGAWVIEPQFDFAMSFNDGAAMVWTKNELRYINKSGKTIATLLRGKDYVKVRQKLEP